VNKTVIAIKSQQGSLLHKIRSLNWLIILLLTVISCFGFVMLYSVAGGHLDPWATKQMIRFALGVTVMITIAVIDLRWWMASAYIIYIGALLMLVAVEIMGDIGMGAQRWLELGPVRLQPSELMKLALTLALARYYHGLTTREAASLKSLVLPLVMIVAPTILVLRQPDLGTAILISSSGMVVMFLAGVRISFFAAGIGAVAAAIPVAWGMLRQYQRDRVLTFLDPERDPMGTGYHIIQSKIAFGSGGISGKGLMLGTQAQLNFLPEKQTDFIFTMLAEELGLIGSLTLLALYVTLIGYTIYISLQIKNHFGRLMTMGLTTTFFFYMFINTAMVMGLVPVVGVPLPLMSYGGSAMMTVLMAYGFILSAALHRNTIIARGGAFA
jgi:rod shape determining protein RodA